MSDYERNKVIRYKPTEEQLKEIKEKYGDLYDYMDNFREPFEVACTEKPFIDYNLFHSYGEEFDDFGRVRRLTEKELDKWVEIFKEVIKEHERDNFRLVDYCWYNCTEAPDYFDESETQDDFYNEV